MLRTEDEPDHIEWGFLEKVAMKKSTSDTMFGGARRTSLSSVNSNVSLENMNSVPSRKSSLGTSSTTFSSFHPAKQEAFGLHSIAENDQRVEEIRRRNTLCLPHLKSSYALEQLKQVVPDEELKKPVLVKTENQQPSRSSVYNRRKVSFRIFENFIDIHNSIFKFFFCFTLVSSQKVFIQFSCFPKCKTNEVKSRSKCKVVGYLLHWEMFFVY